MIWDAIDNGAPNPLGHISSDNQYHLRCHLNCLNHRTMDHPDHPEDINRFRRLCHYPSWCQCPGEKTKETLSNRVDDAFQLMAIALTILYCQGNIISASQAKKDPIAKIYAEAKYGLGYTGPTCPQLTRYMP